MKNINKKIIDFIDAKKFTGRLYKLMGKAYRYTIYSYLHKKLNIGDDKDIAGTYIVCFLASLITLIVAANFLTKIALLLLGFASVISFYRLLDLYVTHFYHIASDENGHIKVENATRYIVYGIINFFEIIICFTALNLFFEGLNIFQINAESILDSAYSIVVSFMTLNYDNFHSAGSLGKVFILLELSYFVNFLFFIFPVILSAVQVIERSKKAKK